MKVFHLAILLVGLMPGVTSQALAQGARTIYFWNGAGGSNNVKIGRWGNGIYEIKKDPGGGEQTLKVTPRNLHEGIRFDINPPADLAPYQAAGYLRMRLRFRPGGGFPGDGGTPGFDTGQPPTDGGTGFGFLISPRLKTQVAKQISPRLAQFENPNGGFGPPGFGPPGFGPPGFGPEMGPPPQETDIKLLQVTLVLDKGVAVGRINIDLEKTKADDEGWRFFLLPVKSMSLTPNAGTLIKRVLLTSDNQDTFTIGEAALTIEGGDMSVAIRRPTDPPGSQISDITVKPGSLTLVADVESGAADPIVEWNFDADDAGAPPITETPIDTGNGPGVPVPGGTRVDARGQQAKFEYPNEEQNYRVEVTVRDRTRKKKPVKASLLVKVRG